tara:strand:+ start:773 stop:892 length:120 start_codon:yes stop_codon:yes gene_type:complete
MIRLFSILLLSLLLFLGNVGCGKKSGLIPPSDVPLETEN